MHTSTFICAQLKLSSDTGECLHDATITLNTNTRRFADIHPSDALAAYSERMPLAHLSACIEAVDAISAYRENASRAESVSIDDHMSIAAHTSRFGALGEMHTGKLLLSSDGVFLPLEWPAHKVAFTTHDRRCSGTIGLFAVPDARPRATRIHAKHFARRGDVVRSLDARRTSAVIAHAPAIVCGDCPTHATVRKHCVGAHHRALRDHGLSSAIGTHKFMVHGGLLSVESNVLEGVQVQSVFVKTY